MEAMEAPFHSDVLLFEEATDRLGPVTGLVNNAGIMGSGRRLDPARGTGQITPSMFPFFP